MPARLHVYIGTSTRFRTFPKWLIAFPSFEVARGPPPFLRRSPEIQEKTPEPPKGRSDHHPTELGIEPRKTGSRESAEIGKTSGTANVGNPPGILTIRPATWQTCFSFFQKPGRDRKRKSGGIGKDSPERKPLVSPRKQEVGNLLFPRGNRLLSGIRVVQLLPRRVVKLIQKLIRSAAGRSLRAAQRMQN